VISILTVIVFGARDETTVPWRTLRPALRRSAGGVPTPGSPRFSRLRRRWRRRDAAAERRRSARSAARSSGLR
jgi:hypothetical protein